MPVRKVVIRPYRVEKEGLNVEAGVSSVVVANVGEEGASSAVASERQRIVQRTIRRGAANKTKVNKTKRQKGTRSR